MEQLWERSREGRKETDRKLSTEEPKKMHGKLGNEVGRKPENREGKRSNPRCQLRGERGEIRKGRAEG